MKRSNPWVYLRYYNILIATTIIIVIFCSEATGQVSYGGRPYPYESKKAVSEVVRMPLFDYNLVLKQMEEERVLDGKKPLPVAWNYEVNLNPYNSGYWHLNPDGVRVWRLEIHSDNAFALNVLFDEFRLEEGARIFLYDPAQINIRGGFDSRSNKIAGNFPVSFIPGEKIIVELQVPENLHNFGELNIGLIGHAFVDLFGTGEIKDGRFGKSEACNEDINCPAGDDWQEVKRAVCRIIFISGMSSILCTGTLINNTAVDGKPYLFTANHCINKDSEAKSAVFYFGYESPECNGPDGSVNNTLAGSVIKATSDSLDFSLLLLSEEPPESYNPYFAGWTLSSNPAPSSVCIHHPQGDVKKISVNNDPVTSQYQVSPPPPSWLASSTPNGFWRVIRWSSGATEGGSSGSPLMNSLGLIVGNLTGGDADCDDPVNDYFSKFHLCWDYYSLPAKQLKPWLDESETGRTILPGYDPLFEPDTSSTILDILTNSPEHTYLTSAIFAAGLQDLVSGNETVTVFAPVDQAFENLLPGVLNELLSDLPLVLEEVIKNHIVNNDILSYELVDGQKLTAFSGREIPIFENENGIYYDYAELIDKDFVAKNGIVHFINEVILSLGTTGQQYLIFPNPAVGNFWILSEKESIRGAKIRFYDMNGSLLADYVISDEKLVKFNLSNFPTGIYIVEIINNNNVFRKKIVLAKPNR